MRKTTHQLVPTAWAAASPSAHVTEDAYERIAGIILDALRSAGKIDAVYLDLHGAMVAEHLDDGEGELLSRVRAVVGSDIPVVASLDLHANVTQKMLEHADALIAYRTYPHVDMADTGARVARFLQRRLAGTPRPRVSARRVPFLIPLQTQSTMLEPAKSIYEELERLEDGSVASLSFAPGFPAADFPECGPTVVAYAEDPAAASRVADALRACRRRARVGFRLPGVHAGGRRTACDRACGTCSSPGRHRRHPGQPGCRRRIRHHRHAARAGQAPTRSARRSDSWSTRPPRKAAHEAGQGSSIEIALGGKSNIPGDAPFRGRFVVERLSDGKLTCTGPFYRGARMSLGPSACLKIGGVRVVVACEKPQMADQELYRFVGIEPTQQAILVNKSSVHFRADFAPIAEEILVCKAPGPMLADPSDFPWKNLAPGIRLKPQRAHVHTCLAARRSSLARQVHRRRRQ